MPISLNYIGNTSYCYYGQVNSVQIKSSVDSKWASKHLWGGGGTIYFAGDGTR